MVIKVRLKPYIPFMISLTLGLVLFTLIEDFVETFIVLPLLRVIWFFIVIVQSIPQGVLWIGFIFVMLIVTVTSLTKGKKPDLPNWQIPATNVGTVERWARLLENAQNSRYSKWRLAQQLKRLTQKFLSPIDVDKGVRFDISALELPAEIRAYFDAKFDSGGSLWGGKNKKSEKIEMGLDLDPEVVLQHLKERLNL